MSQITCDHCFEKVIVPVKKTIDQKEHIFCCVGCQTVYEILQKNNLQDYYQLREGQSQSISQKNKKNQLFSYLDDPDFQNQFVAKTDTYNELSFYIEGVHCAACLWILEKLPEVYSEILESKLNMSTSTLTVRFSHRAKISQIASTIAQLGYHPHPLFETSDISRHKKVENKKDITRIAIAFFCMGNIMLFAFSNYFGAENEMRNFFDALSGVLFLPVLFYASLPFYKNSLGSLKSKSLSIDIPIVLALILGSGLSYYSFLTQQDHIYFDTLATLVFLILTSRFLLKVSQQRSLQKSNIFSFFANFPAKKLVNGKIQEVFTRYLQKDDIVLVEAGDTIPLDGVVIEGKSQTNNALISGEIKPISVQKGSSVFSGCINNNSNLKIKITKTLDESRLGKMLKEIERGWQQKTKIIEITDKVSKYFVIIQLALAIFAFIYFYFTQNFDTAYLRTLTLIIITCPCALGLTPPLTITLTLSKLAKLGIILKDETVIEKVYQAKEIYLDKTGTLTKGLFEVTKWESLKDEKWEKQITFALETISSHPIAKALKDYIAQDTDFSPLELREIEEIPGIGITGKDSEDRTFKIEPNRQSQDSTSFRLTMDEELMANIYLEDTLIDDAKNVLDQIRKRYKTFILSGDNKSVVEKVGAILGFNPEQVKGELLPQEKREIISKSSHAIMMGDGANDAVAIHKANVGIAVANSFDLAMRASNVYFNRPNSLKSLQNLIVVAQETIQIIKRNIYLSLFYNIIGICLALSGQISPLIAAILMPISSFTVLGSSLIATKRMRNID